MFQFLLTVGLVFAAVVGLLAASYVGGVENSGASEESLTSAKVLAWQAIFWVLRHSRPVPVFGSPFERISPLPVPPRPQG